MIAVAWLAAVGVAVARGGSRSRCTVAVGAWLTAVSVAVARGGRCARGARAISAVSMTMAAVISTTMISM
jgi:hypothetical protein